MTMTPPKTLNLLIGEGPYRLRNPRVGPEILYHGQRVNLARVPEALAKKMADEKQFLLVQHQQKSIPPKLP